jgi:very-short-patch-repair endonuclease
MSVAVLRQFMVQAGGVATSSQLREVFTRRTIERALEEKVLERVERGRYAMAEVGEARAQAHRLDGVLALTSAALEWGWAVKTVPERPWVAVAPGRNISPARRDGVELTWRRLAADDLAFGRHTSALRTVTDCAAELPFDDALAVADSALRSRLVQPGDLLAAAQDHPCRGRARVSRVAHHASPLAANPFESTLRALAIQAAPGVDWRPQPPVPIAGFRLHPDVGCEELRIALEADSFEFHGRRNALVADCWRYDELVVADWRVLRFAWEHVMLQQEWVMRTIAALVASRAA